ncbi:MAG: hypothetical protein KIT27_00580 [Legionellales bacterium]|nr:hypothetical protein [Legionellales bacterium]
MLNNLNGKAWIKLSKSVWITQKLLSWSDKVKLSEYSTFLMKRKKYKTKFMTYRPLDETRVKLIELFTQKGQIVFDPNLQHGDTLAAALQADCQFIGIAETDQEKHQAIEHLDYHLQEKPYQLFDKESDVNVLGQIKNQSVNFLLTEIPLFNFKKSIISYQNHLEEIKNNLSKYKNKLVTNGYMALIISDQRYQGHYYARHSDLIHILKETQLRLQGLINVIQDSNALTAYGYPSTYVPNIINQFVIILKK